MNGDSEFVDNSGLNRLRALIAAFLVVVLLALGAGVTAVAYLALRAGEQSERNGELLEQVQDTNARLIDCTTPKGKCYEAGTARTGEAVVGINEATLKVIVAALSCQEDGLTDERELALCTTRRASD